MPALTNAEKQARHRQKQRLKPVREMLDMKQRELWLADEQWEKVQDFLEIIMHPKEGAEEIGKEIPHMREAVYGTKPQD
jgi:hypothetical protein